jgi:hypothetical protein
VALTIVCRKIAGPKTAFLKIALPKIEVRQAVLLRTGGRLQVVRTILGQRILVSTRMLRDKEKKRKTTGTSRIETYLEQIGLALRQPNFLG